MGIARHLSKNIRARRGRPQGERALRRRAEAARSNRARTIARSARRDRILSGKQHPGRHRSLCGRIAAFAHDVSHLAAGLAELMHQRARIEWGFGKDENLSHADLTRERYRGIRPAPGYPALPDHTEKRPLFDLLCAEMTAGINLTENFAMYPAASVSGFYFSHPESKYFAVGKIDRGQIEDYSRRKGMDLRLVERWLSPNLNYDPDAS